MPTASSLTPAAAQIAYAVRAFLACIDGNSASDEARLAATARALDLVSLAYYDSTPPAHAASEGEPPQRDYKVMREAVATRFPTLGYYGSAPPGSTLDAELVVGDAIDDLTDIYSELQDVAWCLETTSPEDAVRLFRFGFEHHWGRQVCDVRGAIHDELFGM